MKTQNTLPASLPAKHTIAAAPELLAALEIIANQNGTFATKQPALDYATIGNIARAALARAKGGEA